MVMCVQTNGERTPRESLTTAVQVTKEDIKSLKRSFKVTPAVIRSPYMLLRLCRCPVHALAEANPPAFTWHTVAPLSCQSLRRSIGVHAVEHHGCEGVLEDTPFKCP
jgi:hypothetical protein